MVNHVKLIKLFRILNIDFKKISFTFLFIIVLYEIFIQFRNIFNPLRIIYWKLLHRCLTIEIIHVPIFKVWQFFILSYTFIYLLLAFTYPLIEFHIFPLIPLSIINSISLSLDNSNFTSFFVKAVCYAERNFAASNS